MRLNTVRDSETAHMAKRHRKLRERQKCAWTWEREGYYSGGEYHPPDPDHRCRCRKIPAHPKHCKCSCGAQRTNF